MSITEEKRAPQGFIKSETIPHQSELYCGPPLCAQIIQKCAGRFAAVGNFNDCNHHETETKLYILWHCVLHDAADIAFLNCLTVEEEEFEIWIYLIASF